ncbi:hypothetical protein [Actinacidiphila acidipaludis]|uniref:Uncharacterized protein n=1 Tax=Actinacidiphila acidipaludis TaxID=2873382 RepID=A0ABS7QB18_9ACTN|nr:hypothetical protein [Streptomyces acidipaludis]MBY8878984.1 hypothetical protein [Streptomyces acidipaludis]
MRLERTAVYVLSSVVVMLVGLVVLVTAGNGTIGMAISTSLIASGITSLAFVAIRYFDDADATTTMQHSERLFTAVDRRLDALDRSSAALRHVIASNDASGRWRVFDRHPKEEVGQEINAANGHLVVDVAGLTLRPFCRDWLRHLVERGNATVRLLVQDPTGTSFAQVCHQESRETQTMLDDAHWVTRTALLLAAGEDVTYWDMPPAGQGLQVEVRWFTGFPTITLTSVGDVVYARARFLREGASQTRTFFERYSLADGALFDVYRSYFQVAWESARVPTLDDCSPVPQ